jgi:serine/threonine protein kinase/tetratricopeptide (TPR) repeat protein
MALAAGSRLGAYEVRGLLGAGGMGEVWRARDTRLGREVAIKVLPGDFLENEERKARFEREARTLASLNHPGIAAIYSFEEIPGSPGSPGRHLLVMELVNGESLDARIARGPLPFEEILSFAWQIADALAAAHGHGVIHRDLKPGNVMISDERRPKILDFGLARVSTPPSFLSLHTESMTEALTAQGNMFGTVPYMAPEQLRGEMTDARSDLFSFGAMLYEMASGRRAFPGVTGAEVAASILKEDPPALEGIRTDLPAAFVRIIGHCLEKDPRQRVQSAADLRHQLSDLAEELRTRPGAVALAAPPTQPVARRRWVPIAALAAVLLMAAGALLVLKPFGSKPALAKPIQSLAVLPLKNYSGDASQDYFADGMTDALIANLAQIRALKVISRTSVTQYKETKKPIPEIAKELGVEGIVEGSVMRSGSRVRITAQLIDARLDRHLWASNYEREMTDVLALQSDVVREIASQIRVQVTAQEKGRLSAARPVDPVVYDTTLRAWAKFEHGTHEQDLRQAAAMFQSALDRDPGYASAWAGLALANFTLCIDFWQFVSPKDVVGPAIAAAEKALALDPDLPEGHYARADIYYWGTEWDFARAQAHYERALDLRPGYAVCHLDYSQFLTDGIQDLDKARRHLDRIRELDPFSPWVSSNRVWNLNARGRPEEAVEEGRRLFQAQPENWSIHHGIGFAHLRLGKFQEAVRDFEACLKGYGERPLSILGPLGLAYGRAGRREDARKMLAEFEQAERTRYVCPVLKAQVLIGLEQNDEAFRLLEKALEERVASLFILSTASHGMDTWFKDPRWPDLKARIWRAVKLPEGAKPGGKP